VGITTVAAQPVCVRNLDVQGMPVPAVIQATKTGMLYVVSSAPEAALFPITEKPVPEGTVAASGLSTQPFVVPALTLRAVQTGMPGASSSGMRASARELIASLAHEGIYPARHGGRCCHPVHRRRELGRHVFDEQRERVIAACQSFCRCW